MATSTTFPVSTKSAEEYGGDAGTFTPNDPDEDIIFLKPCVDNNCNKVLVHSEVPKNSDLSGQCFINTVVDAYCYHHNLTIRPDDIWSTMMTQFALYISKNAPDLQAKFVNFQGKQTVQLVLPGELKDLKPDDLIKLISDQLDKNLTDDQLKAWILPKFSTTTVNDTVTAGLSFMASVNTASDGYNLLCGIPNVTLQGTAQDWQDLLVKLEKLKEYKLEKWYDLLKPVIQEFVNTKGGTVNTVFWQRICHYEPNASATTYLSGWITVFCVFDKNGNWIDSNWTPKVKAGNQTDGDASDNGDEDDDDDDDDDDDLDGDREMDENLKDWLRVDMDKIAVGLLEVNLELKDSSDAVVEAVLMAGHLGVEVKGDRVTIQPIVGWAVARKSSDEEDENEEDGQFDGTAMGNDGTGPPGNDGTPMDSDGTPTMADDKNFDDGSFVDTDDDNDF